MVWAGVGIRRLATCPLDVARAGRPDWSCFSSHFWATAICADTEANESHVPNSICQAQQMDLDTQSSTISAQTLALCLPWAQPNLTETTGVNAKECKAQRWGACILDRRRLTR